MASIRRSSVKPNSVSALGEGLAVFLCLGSGLQMRPNHSRMSRPRESLSISFQIPQRIVTCDVIDVSTFKKDFR
jgi:hypothetical protein